MKHLNLSLVVCAVALAALAGCASTPKADIHVHAAPDADFSKYATFGFPDQTGTDRGGYSTLFPSYFTSRVRDLVAYMGQAR